ncbi:MAG: prolipoprotein diacylglyceryl transferase [Deltaproteobacteria bacterium]|nr:prolipoprotein diacylglyceryl transferase [Deltaproteobacteria bacterium]
MRPILFYIGDTPIYPFFLTIMVGALIATFVAARMARKAGLSPVAIIDMGIIAMILSVIGSRVFHILFEYPMYYWEHPMRVFDFLAGGFVSLGAYIFSAAGWFCYFRRKQLPILPYFDLIVRVVPVVMFFVRLGCLLTGCCYGRPTDFFFHLVFKPGSTAYYFHQDTPLHASQVYAMACSIVIFVVLQRLYHRRKFHGQVLAVYLMCAGVTRFLFEFTRGDVDRGVYLPEIFPPYGISTGQIVMLLFFGVGVWLYRTGRRRYPLHG